MDEQIYSVSQITREIKRVFSESFAPLWIEGELSGCKRHTSGHLYFTLKDSNAQISCAMWRMYAGRLSFEPVDGMKVQAWGNLEIYEPAGRYQLIANMLRPSGLGDLQRAFEELKQKLQAEGLFELARKRGLPRYPQLLGIVTSASGAALQDMKIVARKRWPCVEMDLRSVRVQGSGAAKEIAQAIRALSDERKVDVIIVGRGGGSLEDLWPFNEEVVARAIFDSKIVVVSAVGHEIDTTIADLVADVRAATPSAAMEIVLPDCREVTKEILALKRRLRRHITEQIRTHRAELKALASHWALREPLNVVRAATQRIDELSLRMVSAVQKGFVEKKSDAERLKDLLAAYRPQAVLERGYAIVRAADGRILRDPTAVKRGDAIDIALARGHVGAEVHTTKLETENS